MLSHLDPASALAFGLLVFALIMVIAFEATNGFHDAANAVATVIYTKSLAPGQAVVLSGVLNFVGVMVGGIAVACALVERGIALGLPSLQLADTICFWILPGILEKFPNLESAFCGTGAGVAPLPMRHNSRRPHHSGKLQIPETQAAA
jgi:hypothetical protein